MIRAAQPAAKKVATAVNLEQMLQESSSVLMADFTGLSVAQFDNLRLECFKNEIRFFVTKNTLAKLVFEKLGHTGFDKILTGPTGFCFGFDDPIVPIRILYDFIKVHKLPEVKACLLDGKIYNPEQVEELKDIPSRDVLIGMIVGSIASPLGGFVSTLNEIVRSFVSVVDAVREKAEADPAGRDGLSAIGGSVESIIEAIEKMTVLELVDLKKALEDKFGVSAAAPVAMAGMMPGAGAAEAEEVEEQTEFDVILTAIGDKKIQVIKEVRAITGLGLKEAKALVDEAPKPIKETISKDEAMEIKEKIEGAGGQVEIK